MPPENDRNTRPHVIVVGAGFAGLAAATSLAEKNFNVTLLESTRHAGGRARSFEDRQTGRTIDNGQHLLMGCYRETQAFLRRIGSESGVFYQRNMEVEMRKPDGRPVRLRCPALPAPLHLAAGLLAMKGLGPLHRASALRVGLSLRSEVERPDDNESCDAWLRRMGQTDAVRRCFWDPLIWGTLNDDPLVSSAAMLLAVIDRAFMTTRDASRFGIPKVGLSDLYVEPALRSLREAGACIELGQSVRQFVIEHGRCVGVVTREGQTLRADAVISAVPPYALLALIPERARDHYVFHNIARLDYAPIVNIWAVLDRPLFTGPYFLGLVDSPLHWIFDRNRVEGLDASHPQLISVTISGARSFVLDRTDSLRGLLESELARFFPSPLPRIQKLRIVKEKRATISHAVGSYLRRPETQSPIEGLLLAGDWVRTGLPATIESAVQSGHDAAKVAEERVLRVTPRTNTRSFRSPPLLLH